jgi:predicted TIM-barrel fold metal-dependent hydrolase
VPAREELVAHRIWDTHYHGFMGARGAPASAEAEALQFRYDRLLAQHHAAMFYADRMGIERVVSLDIGGGDSHWGERAAVPAAAQERNFLDAGQRKTLELERDRLSGIIRIHPSHPEESCAKMEKWIRHGPCIGIKYSGGAGGVSCSHPNNDPIIRLARELDAVVYVHAWFLVGGEPRTWTGGMKPGESSPLDVAMLAGRFPDVPIICGHSGGDWELGARAVRAHENVLFEFSGSDPHSGQVDHAVNELGVDRIVWGGHGPSRSYSTELSKVFEARLSTSDRMKVLGGNYRRMVQKIFRQKGQPLTL